MIPIAFFVTMAEKCAAKTRGVVSDQLQREAATQWHKILGEFDQAEVSAGFGLWMTSADREVKWQLPGSSDIRHLMSGGNPNAKPTPKPAPFTEPRKEVLARVRKIRNEIEAQLPPKTIDNSGHRNHRFDPMANRNDVSDCPVCSDDDRRKYVAALLADLPEPLPSVYACDECKDGQGWARAEDGGVYPCGSCHPAGVPR